MRVINLTPHSIKIFNAKQELIKEYPSEGNLRVPEKGVFDCVVSHENPIPIYQVDFQYDETKIPDPQTFGLENFDDCLLVVSAQAKAAIKSNINLAYLTAVSPYGLVRDNKGDIIGCMGFCW